MAQTLTLGGDGSLFIGCHLTYRFAVPDAAFNNWAILFDVRTSDRAATSVLSKVATCDGPYAVVVLTATDMALRPRRYRYALKRMDAGRETVLLRGDFCPQKATAP